MSGDNIHNRIMKNILIMILCDPDKLSLSILMELKKDLEKLNESKSMSIIKDINGFDHEEEFMVREFKNKI